MFTLTAYRPGPHFIFITTESGDAARSQFGALGPEWLLAELKNWQEQSRPIRRKSSLLKAMEVDLTNGFMQLDRGFKLVRNGGMTAQLVGTPSGPTVRGSLDGALILRRPEKSDVLGGSPFSMFVIDPETTDDEFAMYAAQDLAGVLMRNGVVESHFDRMAHRAGFRQQFGGHSALCRRLDRWNRRQRGASDVV